MNNSMINPSVVDLLEKVNDRYSLVILTSKRARQIIGGSKPKIDIDTKKALTIAINEVDQDAIEYENVGNNINKLNEKKCFIRGKRWYSCLQRTRDCKSAQKERYRS